MTVHHIDTAVGTIPVREMGQGPAVFFIHGIGVNSGLWAEAAANLARTHRVFLPTLPLGSHVNPAPPAASLEVADIAAGCARVLDALDVEDVTVVGNDSGGLITQALAAGHPDRIASVVLTNCDLLENSPPRLFRYLMWVTRSRLATWVLAQSLRWNAVRRLPIAYGSVTRRPIPGDLLERFVTPMIESPAIRRDMRKFAQGISPQVSLAIAERLRDTRIPFHFLWADERHFPLESARRLADIIPSATLEEIPNSGAFVSLDQPYRFAAALRRLVQSRTSDRAARMG